MSCFGDSLTEGVYSAPWVEALEQRLERPCQNFGVNALTAARVARRANDAASSDWAVVLAGTNDAMLELADRANNKAMLAFYFLRNGLPLDYRPGPEAFAAAYRGLLASVRARRVAVVSLPPLGEAETGAAADVIAAYNARIKQMAADDPRCVYVPFAEALASRMPPASRDGQKFSASTAGFGRSIALMFGNTAIRRLPLGPDFQALAAGRGLTVTHDKIHLTEPAAAILLELLVGALGEGSSAPRSPP